MNIFKRRRTLKRRTTPDNIQSLQKNEVFVFGSNLGGKHYGGAAHIAHDKFGAIMNQSYGRQGFTFAIPTLDVTMKNKLSLNRIQGYIDTFINHAKNRLGTDKIYLVTEIGCGIAGFTVEEIAPLFKDAINVKNIHLPKKFWNVLLK